MAISLRCWCATAASTLAVTVLASPVSGSILVDFSTRNDTITPLENGRALSSIAGDYEQGLFSLTSSGGLGAAIFDSTDPGPNSSGGDPDLLVNLGNLVIIQNDAEAGITNGVYTTPDDDQDGGTLNFAFTSPSYLESVVLADINGNAATTVSLLDINGLERVYSVPSKWTNDISVAGPLGYGVLDLITLANQPGEGTGGDATASEDAGFDPTQVVNMNVDFMGSAGLTNLTFVPTPGAAALGAIGVAAIATRRRR